MTHALFNPVNWFSLAKVSLQKYNVILLLSRAKERFIGLIFNNLLKVWKRCIGEVVFHLGRMAWDSVEQEIGEEIEHRHKKELEQIGLSAIDFVKTVAKGFNQIREGTGNSILLVIFNDDLNYTAGIDLSLSGDHWEVKTAEPRRREDIEKRKLLWEKQHTFSANRRRSLP